MAGNFSAFWEGLLILVLMLVGYWISLMPDMVQPDAGRISVRRADLRLRPGGVRLPGHGAGDDRRGQLRPGVGQRPVGLRTEPDRSRSPNIKEDIKKNFGFEPDFENAKHNLEKNDGAGNTFKATAKPVLIGTAVVGATTMMFGIILLLDTGRSPAAAT